MELGRMVVDKGLLDKNGQRAGTVDDLLLATPEGGTEDATAPLEVVAIVAGPLALSQNLPRWLGWLFRQAYHLLGVSRPQPVQILWSHVSRIDVMVHLDVGREEVGLNTLAAAVIRRFIGRIPGA